MGCIQSLRTTTTVDTDADQLVVHNLKDEVQIKKVGFDLPQSDGDTSSEEEPPPSDEDLQPDGEPQSNELAHSGEVHAAVQNAEPQFDDLDTSLASILNAGTRAKYCKGTFSKHYSESIREIHTNYSSNRLSYRHDVHNDTEKALQQYVVRLLGDLGWYCVLYEYDMKQANGKNGKGDLVFVQPLGNGTFRALVVETKILNGTRPKFKKNKVIEQTSRYVREAKMYFKRSKVLKIEGIPITAYGHYLEAVGIPRNWLIPEELQQLLPQFERH